MHFLHRIFIFMTLIGLALSLHYRRSQTTAPNYHSGRKNLFKIYEAQNLEFAFPSETKRREALRNGNYVQDTPLPIDVDVYYPSRASRPKVFVTVPRFGSGVPYSLAVLTDVVRPNGTEIQPYPSYDWHDSHGEDCQDLTSVYRIQIDSCNQMWILDSGEIDFVQHCPPSLITIDLTTNKEIRRYKLPDKMYKPNISRFVTVLVDIADPAPEGRCEKAFVYMADPTGVGFVVYDVANGKSWRVENKYTYPDPNFGTHTVAGESFQLLDGVLGMSVTPHKLNLKRMLYFNALTGDKEIGIPLEIVNNGSLWESGLYPNLDEFVVLGSRNVQCVASAMSELGVLFCGFLDPIGIFAWDIRTKYTKENRRLVAENPATLQFMSGMKVIKDGNDKEQLWVLSNRLQKAFSGTVNFHEINYRLQKCGVTELLNGKGCKP